MGDSTNSGSSMLKPIAACVLSRLRKISNSATCVRQSEHSLNLDSDSRHLNSNLNRRSFCLRQHIESYFNTNFNHGQIISASTAGRELDPGMAHQGQECPGSGRWRGTTVCLSKLSRATRASWVLDGGKRVAELTSESIDRLRLAAFSTASMPMPKSPSSALRPG